MKQILLTLLVLTSIISTPLAYAELIDANADIKAEFKSDLPKSYADAIKNAKTFGATTTTEALTQDTSSDSNPEDQIGPKEFSFTQSDQDQVRVVYTGHAQLFGFLPVPVEIEVAVDADGKARVAFPWYRFLLTHEDSAAVENSLSAMVQSKTKLPTPNGILTEADQAIIMGILKENLQFHFTH